MLANLVPYFSKTRRVEMWRECSDLRIFPFIKMTTSELLSHGMSLLGQNVVGSTNVGALPLLSKIGKVRVLCLQFLHVQIVLEVCNVYYIPLQIILCLHCLPVQIILCLHCLPVQIIFFSKLGLSEGKEEQLVELTRKFTKLMEERKVNVKLIFLILEQYKLFFACCYLHLWWYFWYWLQNQNLSNTKSNFLCQLQGVKLKDDSSIYRSFKGQGRKAKVLFFQWTIFNIFYEKVIKDHISGSQLGGRRVPRGYPHWHPLRPPGKQRCQHWGGFCLRDSSKVYCLSPNRSAKAKVFFLLIWQVFMAHAFNSAWIICNDNTTLGPNECQFQNLGQISLEDRGVWKKWCFESNTTFFSKCRSTGNHIQRSRQPLQKTFVVLLTKIFLRSGGI